MKPVIEALCRVYAELAESGRIDRDGLSPDKCYAIEERMKPSMSKSMFVRLVIKVPVNDSKFKRTASLTLFVSKPPSPSGVDMTNEIRLLSIHAIEWTVQSSGRENELNLCMPPGTLLLGAESGLEELWMSTCFYVVRRARELANTPIMPVR